MEGSTSEEESDVPDLETDPETEEQKFKKIKTKYHTPPNKSTPVKTTNNWADLPPLLEGSDDENSDNEDVPDLMSDSSNDDDSDYEPPDMETDYDTDAEQSKQPHRQPRVNAAFTTSQGKNKRDINDIDLK